MTSHHDEMPPTDTSPTGSAEACSPQPQHPAAEQLKRLNGFADAPSLPPGTSLLRGWS
ncbi:hypothetical protein [Gordonia soli]|uniref:hypothetical protein n=1 Tax=Gordonia soli TaxID=320799 RepID=UPI0012FA1049|nr:hypothetical protein [Gordonia soli]